MIHNMEKFNTWLPAGFDGQFQWDFISIAFNGTNIMPMDYDAVVERKGHRLIFETKEPGKKIDMGQAITLHNEWRLNATILQISGKTPDSINGYALYKSGEFDPQMKIGDKPLIPGNWFDVSYVTHRWFHWADGSASMRRQEYERYCWRWDYDRKEDELNHLESNK